MNFYTVGDNTINLDQILYISVSQRDNEGQPDEATVYFPASSKKSSRTRLVLKGAEINGLLEAVAPKVKHK